MHGSQLDRLERSYVEMGMRYALLVANEPLQRYLDSCGPSWAFDGRFQERRARRELDRLAGEYARRGFEPLSIEDFVEAARGADLSSKLRTPREP